MPRFSSTLKQHNVTLVNEEGRMVQCNQCGQHWIIDLKTGGRLPYGYWHCPNGCNWTRREFKHPHEVRAFFAERNRKQRQKK